MPMSDTNRFSLPVYHIHISNSQMIMSIPSWFEKVNVSSLNPNNSLFTRSHTIVEIGNTTRTLASAHCVKLKL